MMEQPCKAQVGALPVKGEPGKYAVLLVTSRETRRWVIPKGWPIKGLEDHEAAAQEAFEEAGVVGRIHKHPMGAYTYIKENVGPIRVMVYLLEVSDEAEHWPEKDQRRRKWALPAEAARVVYEPGLAEIIKRLDVGPMDAR